MRIMGVGEVVEEGKPKEKIDLSIPPMYSFTESNIP